MTRAMKIPHIAQPEDNDPENEMMAGIIADEAAIESSGANEMTPATGEGEERTPLTPEILPEEMIAGIMPRKSRPA